MTENKPIIQGVSPSTPKSNRIDTKYDTKSRNKQALYISLITQ